MYQDLDVQIEDQISKNTQAEMVGSDIIIPCLIYVYTKACMPEIVALLAIIDNFTLSKYSDEFDFYKRTLISIEWFIRNEMHKLDSKTERFTYNEPNRLSMQLEQLS